VILRFHRIHGLDRLSEVWRTWEAGSWTSKRATLRWLRWYLPSPQPDHSWVTAARAVLDAAILDSLNCDIPTDPLADLCIRAGTWRCADC
jgi:hypothetical protein